MNDDAGEPMLTRAQVWRGLVMKAENAVPFVPAMTRCEVVERRENQLVREIVLRGERLTERVTFYPEFAKVMEADYLTTMSATVRTIRDLVKEGRLVGG